MFSMATQTSVVSKSTGNSEALARARSGISLANYPTIYREFTEKGLPESEIRPRENVFTYRAWRELGRQVRRGEHGVKVFTFIDCEKKNEATGVVQKTYRRPWTTTVFHISQTDPISGGAQ
jgi:hypothetical protein